MNHSNRNFWMSIEGMIELEESIKYGCCCPENIAWLRTQDQYSYHQSKYAPCAAHFVSVDSPYNSTCPVDTTLYVCMMCKI